MTGVAQSIDCQACGASLALVDVSKDYGGRCGSCGAVTWLAVFPAALEAPKSSHADLVADEAEASCFYHQGKRAHVHCDSCGRFLCKLCQIELGGQNLCPTCLETGQKTRTLSRLDNQRTLYDTVALALSTIPILAVWPIVICAPISIFITIWNWKKPLSVLPRTKVRYILAIVFALLDLGLITALLIGAFRLRTR